MKYLLLPLLISGCGVIQNTHASIKDLPYAVGDKVVIDSTNCPVLITGLVGPKSTIGQYSYGVFCNGFDKLPTSAGIGPGSMIVSYWEVK